MREIWDSKTQREKEKKKYAVNNYGKREDEEQFWKNGREKYATNNYGIKR